MATHSLLYTWPGSDPTLKAILLVGHMDVVPVEPGSGLFCKHAIEVGTPVEEQIPVLAGLEVGQLVVVDGTFRLKAENGKAAAQKEH